MERFLKNIHPIIFFEKKNVILVANIFFHIMCLMAPHPAICLMAIAVLQCSADVSGKWRHLFYVQLRINCKNKLKK
jgi:hypothetical protein